MRLIDVTSYNQNVLKSYSDHSIRNNTISTKCYYIYEGNHTINTAIIAPYHNTQCVNPCKFCPWKVVPLKKKIAYDSKNIKLYLRQLIIGSLYILAFPISTKKFTVYLFTFQKLSFPAQKLINYLQRSLSRILDNQ